MLDCIHERVAMGDEQFAKTKRKMKRARHQHNRSQTRYVCHLGLCSKFQALQAQLVQIFLTPTGAILWHNEPKPLMGLEARRIDFLPLRRPLVYGGPRLHLRDDWPRTPSGPEGSSGSGLQSGAGVLPARAAT
jgi:hypothetical protein